MTDSEKKELSVGEDFLESLASSNLANWQAANELIANSIDAWFDINSKDHQLAIEVQIEQDKDLQNAQFILSDNAMGMDKGILEKAVTSFLESPKKKGKNAKRKLKLS